MIRLKASNLLRLDEPALISVRSPEGNRWWKEPAHNPHRILTQELPKEIHLILHTGLTPEKCCGSHYAVSDMLTGICLSTAALLPVFRPLALSSIIVNKVLRWNADGNFNLRMSKDLTELTEQLVYQGIQDMRFDSKRRIWLRPNLN